MNAKVPVLSLSVAAMAMLVALWVATALADEGPGPQGDLEFNARVHSLQASGGKVEIGATFENRNASPERVNLLLDVETANGDDRLVFQEFAEDELLEPGEAYTLRANWSPEQPGAYRVKLGVFSADWSVVHEWVGDAAEITRIDDGAGTRGWLLDVSRQESHVHQSSKSRFSQSSIVMCSYIGGNAEGGETCDEREITGGGPLSDAEVRERMEDAREQARERTEELQNLRNEIREALGR